MNKIIVGAVFAVAALFTACETTTSTDSTTSNIASCDIKGNLLGLEIHTCVESENTAYINSQCAEANQEATQAGEGTAVIGTKCPTGAKKSCEVTQKGVTATVYMYDNLTAMGDCSGVELD
jgi:hypothetical protein